jgi:hypothetical protein
MLSGAKNGKSTWGRQQGRFLGWNLEVLPCLHLLAFCLVAPDVMLNEVRCSHAEEGFVIGGGFVGHTNCKGNTKGYNFVRHTKSLEIDLRSSACMF